MGTQFRCSNLPSLSVTTSGRYSPIIFSPNSEYEEWIREWESIQAKELIDSPLVVVDADASVEEACDVLLSKGAPCIAIRDPSCSSAESPFIGLFDFADVNAFLTLAALQHARSPEELRENPREDEIVKAARAGKVPVRLVSNLSEKNPLEILSDAATLVDLLKLFATGTHRVLIRSAPSPSQSSPSSSGFLGFISDRSVLTYFHSQAKASAPLSRFLNNPLHSVTLPSINLRSAVVSCTANARVVDAMSLMSSEGVSSVAIVEDTATTSTAGQSTLLSAVSVTDIGKIVVPSQNNYVLQMPLQKFVSQIKEPDGSTDGEDKYPVYSVSARSTLRFAIEKILATNAHRVFVTEGIHSGGSSPVMSSSPTTTTSSGAPYSSPPPTSMNGAYLRGVVSVVDVLALFAQLAGLSDVDPSRMHRHRRFSSASSQGSGSGRSPEVKPVGVGIH